MVGASRLQAAASRTESARAKNACSAFSAEPWTESFFRLSVRHSRGASPHRPNPSAQADGPWLLLHPGCAVVSAAQPSGGAAQMAATTSLKTASMSSAFSLVKGRGMSCGGGIKSTAKECDGRGNEGDGEGTSTQASGRRRRLRRGIAYSHPGVGRLSHAGRKASCASEAVDIAGCRLPSAKPSLRPPDAPGAKAPSFRPPGSRSSPCGAAVGQGTRQL